MIATLFFGEKDKVAKKLFAAILTIFGVYLTVIG